MILVAVGPRDENAFSLMRDTTSFIKKYLTPNAITQNLHNFNSALEDYVDQLENSRRISKRKKSVVYSSGYF